MQRIVSKIDFSRSAQDDRTSGYLYSARFFNDGNFIAAGGAGRNELKIFSNNVDSTGDFKIQMELKDLPCPVFSLDSANHLKQLAVGLSDGSTYTYNYEVNTSSPEFEPYQGEFLRVAQEQQRKEAKSRRNRPKISVFGTIIFGNKENIGSSQKTSPTLR